MTKEEINILAKWMSEVWKVYCRYLQTDMNAWDFDALLAELQIIYENSGNEPLVVDYEAAILKDMERRYENDRAG